MLLPAEIQWHALAAEQGRTRGCRVWRAGRVGGFLSSWVLEAGPGEGGFLLPASRLSPTLVTCCFVRLKRQIKKVCDELWSSVC